MLYFSSVLFVVCFLAVAFLVGHLTLRVLRLEGSAPKTLFLGAITGMALFQFCAYPMFRLRMAFTTLFWLYALLLAGLCAYSLCLLIAKRQYRLYARQLTTAAGILREHPFLFFVLLSAFIVFLLCQLCMRFPTTDASYYYPRAMEIIRQNNVGISEPIAWLGWECSAWSASSDASSLEAFRAWLSYASGIQVTVLSRGALLFCTNVLSLCGVYEAVVSLRKRGARATAPVAAYTLIFYMLLVVLCSSGYSSDEHWIFRYGAQGKSMLCSLIVPGLVMACADIFWDQGEHGGYWACAALLLMTGVFLSVVGAFLPVILYFSLGVPILIRWKWKTAVKRIGAILLSLLPVIVYGGLTFLDVMTRSQSLLDLGPMDWFLWFKDQMLWGSGFQLLLYILALACLIRFGSKASRWLLIGSPAVLFLTFLNPLLSDVVAKYVTTAMVYWRLFWLIPCSFVIAFGAAELVCHFGPEKARAGLIGAIAGLALIAGVGVGVNGPSQYARWFMDEYKVMNLYETRKNAYALEDVYIQIGDAILADYQGPGCPRIYDPTLYTHEMIRQYSAEIELACGMRPQQLEHMKEPLYALGITQAEFFREQSEHPQSPDVETLAQICDELGVSYLCVPKNLEYLPEGAEAHGFVKVLDYADWYEVWRCP